MGKGTLCGLLAGLFLSFAPSVKAYDLSDRFLTHDPVENIIASTVRLRVGTKYRDVDNAEHHEGTVGTGIFLCDQETGQRYILTSEHLFPADARAPFYVITTDTGITDYKRSHAADLALLTTNDTQHSCFAGKIASTSPHPGTFLLYVGYPAGEVPFLREGRIMAHTGENFIIAEVHYSPGDSGGPTVAFEYGQPVLVGINRMVMNKGGADKAWGIAISGSAICQFLEETAVHDDYCEAKK